MRKIALSATRHFVVTPAKPNRDTRWFDQYFEEKVIDDREGGYSGNTEIPLKSHRMA